MSNYPGLKQAAAEGADALKAFIRAEQIKRDDKARKEWAKYALFRAANFNNYSHIINPDGLRYRHETTINGTHRFVGPPDNTFVDSVNSAAERAGIALRLEGKHLKIAELLCAAVRRGERAWVFCPATEGWESGYVTVDPSAVPAPAQPATLPTVNEFRTASAKRPAREMVGATGQEGR